MGRVWLTTRIEVQEDTEPARDMAREKFGKVLDFLDGVIEYVSDATSV